MNLLVPLLIYAAATAGGDVFFQAHRGGLAEVPENTLLAYRYAWGIAGAVPEIDVCVTADGRFVCLHDDTLERTTDAPPEFSKTPVSKLSLEQVRAVNAAARMPGFPAQRVPLLEEVLDEMRRHPDRLAYLDLKQADLRLLRDLIEEYGVESQLIFVHADPAYCGKILQVFPAARTMTWLSGPPDHIKRRFNELADGGFAGLSQLQLHLKATRRGDKIDYALDRKFLKKARETAARAGVDLQVRPFEFNEKSLRALTDLGIRWFVADEPRRFAAALRAATQE